MRKSAVLLLLVPPIAVLACGDAAKGAFETAAAEDRDQHAMKAVELYLAAHKAAPDSRYGKLALARTEVLLLDLGGQQINASQWDDLEETAAKLLELESTAGQGALYKGYAAYGKGDLDEAERWLGKATGDLKGVSPPTDLALEATAEALFSGATAGAKSALTGSLVDSAFLTAKRDRLKKRIEADREEAARRQELLKQGTLDAMATLLTNYKNSDEAAEVRAPYAEKVAAKLASADKVGPPTPDDPDPISTLVDALKMRAPEEPATKAALERVEKLRSSWEERYEEEIERVDEQVAERQKVAMAKLADIFAKKCVPLRQRLEKGDQSAAEPLEAAALEAAELIPAGMTPEDLREIQLLIIANCTTEGRP